MNVSGSADWKENITPDEAARFEGYAAALRELQKKRARGGALARALHAKAHVGVTGELEVLGNVPEALRVAVFAEPRKWPVYARFSNGAGERQPDRTPDVRGLALKLVGVPGKKVISGLEDKRTQDFLLVPAPAIPFRDPHEFITFVRSAAGNRALLLPRLIGGIGLGRTLDIVKMLSAMPKVASLATIPFYTAAPLRFGKTAAKLGLFPFGASQASPPQSVPENHLRDDLVTRLKSGPLTWSLRVQLFLDEKTTPIEDTSVVWPEDKTPYQEVARLVFPQQDVTSPRGVKVDEYVERLSFDPWHAVEELRPLGAIMRARAVAYRESVIARNAVAEPDEMMNFG